MEVFRARDSVSCFWLKFADVALFQVETEAKAIAWRAYEGTDERSVHHLLANQVIPRALAHDGHCLLHAGLVRRSDQAILVMGESGRGKSTLSASLRSAGWTLLGDDGVMIASLDGSPTARVTSPSLRLLPDSRAILFPQIDRPRAVAAHTRKEMLPDVAVADTQPHPLSAIFVLEPPGRAGSISLRKLSPMDASVAILANSMALDATDPGHAQVRVEQACALAERVRVHALDYPRRFDILGEVHAAMHEALAQGGE